MSGTIAICQPHYVPWIGYFEMIDRVDAFFFLDDVDFIKREWKNRNRIRKERLSADTKWLTVPIERACQRGTHIRDTRLAADGSWRRAHLDAFSHVYRRAPHFDDARRLLCEGLGARASTLADLNVRLVAGICAYLGIETPLARSSELGTTGSRTEKLVELCRRVGARSYLANNGSAAYLEPGRFADEGVILSYQDYGHPEYVQRSAGRQLPFLSHLSVLDLIANQGPRSLEIIREGRP